MSLEFNLFQFHTKLGTLCYIIVLVSGPTHSISFCCWKN